MNPESLPLRDIHLPEAIGWWPLAPGWWLLMVLIVSLLGFFAWQLLRLPARRRRAALRAIDSLYTSWQVQQDNRAFLSGLSALLRQHAIGVSGRQLTAGLSGAAWLDHLNNGLADSPFSGPVGEHLVRGPYQADSGELTDAEIQQLLTACRQRVSSAE